MALATLAQLKRYMGLTTSTDDTLLQELLDAAEVAVLRYLERGIESAQYTAVVDGNGAALLTLPQYPITAVSSLKIDGRAIPASTGYGVAGFYFADNALRLRGEYRFTLDCGNVEVSYTAGYQTVPDAISQAVVEMAALRYKERDWLGYQSKSLAGETVSFQTDAMSKNVRAALAPYQNVVPV